MAPEASTESQPLLPGSTSNSKKQQPKWASPKTRKFTLRAVLALALVLVVAFLGFSAHSRGPSSPHHHKDGKSHKHKRPELAPMIRVADLPHDRRLKQGSENRVIIMGDVHGMYKEMERLLKKLKFDPTHDQLILTGDFTTKGPDSCAVLDAAIKYNAACVRGNHEDEILRFYVDYYKLDELRTYPPFASKTTHKWGEALTATLEPTYGPSTIIPWDRPTAKPEPGLQELEGDYKAARDVHNQADKKRDMQLVKYLKPHHVHYLANCPAIMKVGQISNNGVDAAVVHGGLEWQIRELEDQKPETVMRIRGVLPPEYQEPCEASEGRPWFDLWNEEQARHPPHERCEVIYGHDASKGLQLHKYSRGLDSKCQRGEKLSAIVLELDDDGKYHQTLHQLKC